LASYVSADPVKTSNHAMQPTHVYEVRPRKDHRSVDLISDALPFGRLWYGEPDAIGYAKFRSRSHDAVIREARFQRTLSIGLKCSCR
jgi:hypothetical protein